MFIFRDFVHYHGVVENRVSCTVRCTIVATAMENLATCMIEGGVKETMSQWIFISLIATNERVVYSRF